MRVLLISICLATRMLSAWAQGSDPMRDVEPGTDAEREAGRALYEQKCAQCHGVIGDGVSPASPFLRPTPRNFRSGMFKFRTTESGELPTDEDIKRSIVRGMPYTGMPAWPSLSDEEVTNLMYYIKTFSEDFVYFGDVVRFEVPDPPEITDESIARGREVYVENQCTECHGSHGRSNGISSEALRDMWGTPIKATDMTMRWTFRGGTSREDIYRTFTSGMDGTPMPAYRIEPPEDRWHLVNYVASLSEDEPDYGTVVRAVRVSDVSGALPSPESFRDAPPTRFPVVAQLMEPERSFFPAALAIEARAVVSEEHIAIMIQWNDMSAQVTGTNGPEIAAASWPDDTDTTGIYSDAVAVQFPSKPEPGHPKPHFLFGDTKRAADVWFASLSETESRHYVGRGSGLLQLGGPALDMWSNWDDGQWTVIFRRARSEDEHSVFEDGRFVPVAFSVWDGFSRERGNRRGVTSWYHLYVESVDSGSPTLKMIVVGLMTLLVGVFATIRLQWTFLGADARGNVLRQNEYLLYKCPIGRPIRRIINREGLSTAIWKYRKLRGSQPDTYDFSPGELLRLADSFLREGNVPAALALLHLNIESHPGDSLTLQRLGKAYLQAGERARAIEFYEKSAASDQVEARSRYVLAGLRRG